MVYFNSLKMAGYRATTKSEKDRVPPDFTKSIQVKLVGLIVIALVAALSLSSFLIYLNARKALTNYAEQSVATLAISSSKEIGLWLDGKKSYISSLAATLLIQSGNKTMILPYLASEVERLKQFETLFVSNDKGDFISYTQKASKIATSNTGNLSDRVYFKRVMQGDSVISDPVLSKTTNMPVTVIAVPIKKEGRIIGLMGGTIPLDELAQRVATVKVARTGYAFVIQGDGRTIIHQDSNVAMKANYLREGDDTDPRLRKALSRMVHGEDGVARYIFKNVDKYMGYAPVTGVNWSLGVTVPVKEVTGQLSTMTTISWLTPLLVAAVISLITYLLLTVVIIRPVGRLRASMSRVETGNLEVQDRSLIGNEIGPPTGFINKIIFTLEKRLGSSGDEVGQVTESFHRMVEKLKLYQQNLEDMVSERTAELEKAYEELKQLDEMKSAFLSSVSHELR
ncbi:MAG: Cache 3/Cache 2 fusion domain-containing protein, partial [Nitrospirae bacterium]|nr:Cache 3/Cache 2 fusion domain-containing protein [Nitrospirota bacterium]